MPEQRDDQAAACSCGGTGWRHVRTTRGVSISSEPCSCRTASAAQDQRHIEEARYLLDRHDSGQAGFLRPHELAAIRYLLDARRQEESTMRVLIAALRETLRLFWHAPGETVAMTVTHILSDKVASRRWYEKAKEKADAARSG